MATIHERTNKQGKKKYTVEVRLKGHPRQSATFERLTDAKIWMQQTEAAIREGRYFRGTTARKKTLGDVIDRYLKDCLPYRHSDHQKFETHLEWWKQNLGYCYLSDLTPVLIAEYRDKLMQEPKDRGGIKTAKNQSAKLKTEKRSHSTIIRYMATLSIALSYAVKEWGWLDDNPVLKVRKPKALRGRVRFLSDKERETLLEAVKASPSPYLYTVVILALSTGARWSEILNLKRKDIDFKRKIMHLEHTKNGDRRSIPLSKYAYEQVSKLNKVHRIDTEYFFPRSDGKKPVELRKPWLKALKNSELIDFHFHDLRHTAASYLAMGGASLTEISEILGHKTLAMVKRYSHLTERHTAGVLERMNEVQFDGRI